MSWINCKINDNYEIFTEYPFYIRRKSNKCVVSDYIDSNSNGYPYVALNGLKFYKHRIVASHFIQNDAPLTKQGIEHINNDKTDYHLQNLRWVSRKEKMIRKAYSSFERDCIGYDETPDDIILVETYGKHEFEDYYYSAEKNSFYLDNSINLRILRTCYDGDRDYINAISKEGKKVKIYFDNFKRLYGFKTSF